MKIRGRSQIPWPVRGGGGVMKMIMFVHVGVRGGLSNVHVSHFAPLFLKYRKKSNFCKCFVTSFKKCFLKNGKAALKKSMWKKIKHFFCDLFLKWGGG